MIYQFHIYYKDSLKYIVAGTPSAPTGVRLVNEDGQFIIRWESPLNDGGSTITSYALEYRSIC